MRKLPAQIIRPIVLGFLGGLLAMRLFAPEPAVAQNPRFITTQGITLVDDGGAEKAWLSTGPSSTGFFIFDPTNSRQVRAAVKVELDGPEVQLFPRGGGRTVLDGSSVAIYDAADNPRLHVALGTIDGVATTILVVCEPDKRCRTL